MLFKDLLFLIERYLQKNNITEYDKNDLYRLINYIFKIDINSLYLKDYEINVSNYKLNKLKKCLISYYINFVPIAYITKSQNFYNENYYINENVLVPRYDTEVLVETAIKYIEKYNLKKCIDMCTGSGCVGISIAKNSSIDEMKLVDISSEAIKVVKRNVKLNNIGNKCKTVCSDLFNNISKNDKFSLLVANPPYIKLKDKKILSKYVKNEPEIALFGGNDGMDFYKRILDNAAYYLENNAFIIFEIGYDEKEDIKNLISNYKFYDIIEFIKDYGNNDRVVVCHFHQI